MRRSKEFQIRVGRAKTKSVRAFICKNELELHGGFRATGHGKVSRVELWFLGRKVRTIKLGEPVHIHKGEYLDVVFHLYWT